MISQRYGWNELNLILLNDIYNCSSSSSSSSSRGEVMTDGCGFVSTDISTHLRSQLLLHYNNSSSSSSSSEWCVFQIRCVCRLGGFKGATTPLLTSLLLHY